MDDKRITAKEFLEMIMTRREAEQYLNLTSGAMQHHLRNNNIKPCKEYGSGKGKVQLFWLDDVKELEKLLK